MNGFERVLGGWVVPQVVQIADLLHAEPAELGAAEGARHVVARAVVHLGDEHLAARARLDVVACSSTTKSETEKLKKNKKTEGGRRSSSLHEFDWVSFGVTEFSEISSSLVSIVIGFYRVSLVRPSFAQLY